MKVYIYCYSKRAFERVKRNLFVNNISNKQEKQELPLLKWVFEVNQEPELRNLSDIEIRKVK